jgi:hypothetical protein
MNFLYEYNSFIEMNDFGAIISITGSTFSNMNSCGSLIRNKRLLWQDTTLTQVDYVTYYKSRSNNYQYALNSLKYASGVGIPASTPYATCSTSDIT